MAVFGCRRGVLSRTLPACAVEAGRRIDVEAGRRINRGIAQSHGARPHWLDTQELPTIAYCHKLQEAMRLD